jgi:hypothetical protein
MVVTSTLDTYKELLRQVLAAKQDDLVKLPDPTGGGDRVRKLFQVCACGGVAMLWLSIAGSLIKTLFHGTFQLIYLHS